MKSKPWGKSDICQKDQEICKPTSRSYIIQHVSHPIVKDGTSSHGLGALIIIGCAPRHVVSET